MLTSCLSLKESQGLREKGALGRWLFPAGVEFKLLLSYEGGRESAGPGSKPTD